MNEDRIRGTCALVPDVEHDHLIVQPDDPRGPKAEYRCVLPALFVPRDQIVPMR